MIQTEAVCPACSGKEAMRIGEAVTVARGVKGVTETKAGRVYGCLRCGANYCVTNLEVFGPKRQPVKAVEREAGPRPTRNGDRDLISSPEMMR